MNEFLGADPDQLRELAGVYVRRANELSDMESLLHGLIEDVLWVGQDADNFREEWRSGARVSLVDHSDELFRLARLLNDNADEQDAASGPDSYGPPGGAAGAAAGTGAAGGSGAGGAGADAGAGASGSGAGGAGAGAEATGGAGAEAGAGAGAEGAGAGDGEFLNELSQVSPVEQALEKLNGVLSALFGQEIADFVTGIIGALLALKALGDALSSFGTVASLGVGMGMESPMGMGASTMTGASLGTGFNPAGGDSFGGSDSLSSSSGGGSASGGGASGAEGGGADSGGGASGGSGSGGSGGGGGGAAGGGGGTGEGANAGEEAPNWGTSRAHFVGGDAEVVALGSGFGFSGAVSAGGAGGSATQGSWLSQILQALGVGMDASGQYVNSLLK